MEQQKTPEQLKAEKQKQLKLELQKLRDKAPKATFQDLIARKMQKESNKTKLYEIYVPSMGKNLLFKRPDDETLFDLMDEMDKETTAEVMEGTRHLIYLSCDMLQDQELQQELDVVDPFDTVSAVFDLPDVNMISNQLVDAFGLGSVEDSLKNSLSATQN